MEEAVRQMLMEFAGIRGREMTTVVMFVEAEDLREAYQEAAVKDLAYTAIVRPLQTI